jgi:hypothetical protein
LSQKLEEMSTARGGRSIRPKLPHLKNTIVLPHSTTTLEHQPIEHGLKPEAQDPSQEEKGKQPAVILGGEGQATSSYSRR